MHDIEKHQLTMQLIRMWKDHQYMTSSTTVDGKTAIYTMHHEGKAIPRVISKDEFKENYIFFYIMLDTNPNLIPTPSSS